MKQSLINIADKIDARVKEFDGFPRTQATDAMRGIGTDIAKIIREEADGLADDESKIVGLVERTLASLKGK